MARVLGVSCSGRKNGFTATLLKNMLEAVETVDDVEVEMIYPMSYKFGPCISCFDCIRNPEHTCPLNDDFGRKGEGVLFKKIKEANGLIIASAVHNYGITAIAHVFLERLYPFVWSGYLRGMPFVGITCGSNQGMHLEAMKGLCRMAYTLRLQWIDGLPVHTCYYERAINEAKMIGINLAKFAKEDEKRRRKFTDTERMLHYQSLPWKPLEVIIKNLEMINKSIKNDVFRRKEAIKFLKMADTEYRKAIHYRQLMNYEKAIQHLNLALSNWARATWLEYLEQKVIGVKTPEAYRPTKGEFV